MQLSAPIFKLKRLAKHNSRTLKIPLHTALDQVAASEGFANWSLLARKHQQRTVAQKLITRIDPGDLVLIAARPGQGKTLLGVELAAIAAEDRCSYFFSLECTQTEITELLHETGYASVLNNANFRTDVSDAICSEYICSRLNDAPKNTIAVIDYLQILDQRRQTPPVNRQLEDLRRLTIEKGLILVLLSQVDRQFDAATRDFPGLRDIRMPNTLDPNLFTKSCFLNNGEVRING